jgi:transcriptional regulator with XRE-family HTH domain
MRVARQHPISERDPGFGARLGGRLRAARLAAGETQASLAEGWCTKAAISAYECGAAMPSIEALSQIADRTGVSMSSLLADETDGPIALAERIRGVEIDRGRVVAELTDGRIVGLPLRSVDRLLDASLRDLEGWRLLPGRRAVEWPALGVVVGLETFRAPIAGAAQARPGRPTTRVRPPAAT